MVCAGFDPNKWFFNHFFFFANYCRYGNPNSKTSLQNFVNHNQNEWDHRLQSNEHAHA